MITLVYILCAATSSLCAVMLLRACTRTGTRLLLWSGICFSLLAVANIFLFIDIVIFPQVQLMAVRSLLTACGAVALLFGLIWETV